MRLMRLFGLLWCIALLFLLLACRNTETTPSTNPVSNNNYEIFLSGGGAARSYFEGAVSTKELYPVVSAPGHSASLKSIQIDGVDHEVKYQGTHESVKSVYTHSYETADKKVRVLYWAKDMSLASVGIDANLSDFAQMNQQQYEQWIQDFVSQFVQEDCSKLKLACQTQYGGLTVDGFTSESKGEKVPLVYRFRYNRYIGSIKTTDSIFATFTINAEDNIMRVQIWFNRHEFDSVDVLDLDQAIIEQAINEYLSTYAGENIALKSWNVCGEDELVVINGNIMLSRSIFIKYTWKGIKYDSEYDLLIDIPDA